MTSSVYFPASRQAQVVIIYSVTSSVSFLRHDKYNHWYSVGSTSVQIVQDQKSTTLRKLVEVTKWIMSASSVQPVEAGGVAESESLLGMVLCDFLLLLLLLLLDAAAAVFAIGIERWLLLLMMALLVVRLPITDYLLRVKQWLFSCVSTSRLLCSPSVFNGGCCFCRCRCC